MTETATAMTTDEQQTTDMTELKIAIATLDTKVDGINRRLDVLNGSVVELKTITAKHDTDLAVLNTEKDFVSKLLKPAAIVLAIAFAALAGHSLDIKSLVELFK